jgi:hypothetical protein
MPKRFKLSFADVIFEHYSAQSCQAEPTRLMARGYELLGDRSVSCECQLTLDLAVVVNLCIEYR